MNFRLDKREADFNELPDGERAYLVRHGIVGPLAHLLNDRRRGPALLETYHVSGWRGLLWRLMRMRRPKAMMSTMLLRDFDFYVARCDFGRHWYLRPRTRGRRPEACSVHAKAARQERWEAKRERKLREVKTQYPKAFERLERFRRDKHALRMKVRRRRLSQAGYRSRLKEKARELEGDLRFYAREGFAPRAWEEAVKTVLGPKLAGAVLGSKR